MKNLLFFSLLVCFSAFVACNKQNLADLAPNSVVEPTSKLVANFTIDNPNNTVNESSPVLLTNKSLNAVSYHWDFGNGTTSTEAQPNFAYPRCGIYTITLTVFDSQGTKQTLKKEITSLCIFGGAHGSN